MKTTVFAVLVLCVAGCAAQELQPAQEAASPKLLKVFVQGNNATARELRRTLNWNADHPKQVEEYKKKHPGYQYHPCFELVNNPKDADAIFEVAPERNSGGTGFHPIYTSTAALTRNDGTLLWEGFDEEVGGDPTLSAANLLRSAAKKACQP